MGLHEGLACEAATELTLIIEPLPSLTICSPNRAESRKGLEG